MARAGQSRQFTEHYDIASLFGTNSLVLENEAQQAAIRLDMSHPFRYPTRSPTRPAIRSANQTTIPKCLTLTTIEFGGTEFKH